MNRQFTLAPSPLRARTIPAPMPRAPPVTIATFPWRDMAMLLFCFWGLPYNQGWLIAERRIRSVSLMFASVYISICVIGKSSEDLITGTMKLAHLARLNNINARTDSDA